DIRWETVTASSPLYAEDPLRGQKVIVREISVFGSASAYDIPTNQTAHGYAEQVIQVRDAPLFAYALFYNMDLEIAPGPAMVLNGPVHSNGNLYVQSGSGITFKGLTTSAGKIFYGRKPGSDAGGASGSVKFNNASGTAVSMKQGGVWVDSNDVDWTEKASQLWEGNVMSSSHGTAKANPASIPPYEADDPLTTDFTLKNTAYVLIQPAAETTDDNYPGDTIEIEKLASKACLVIKVSESGRPRLFKYEPDTSGTYRRNQGTGIRSYIRQELDLPEGLIVGGDITEDENGVLVGDDDEAESAEKFKDKRRGKMIDVLDIDIAKLKELIDKAKNDPTDKVAHQSK
ncbi:MAG: hypothetical protein ACREIA_12790, partial [Opitutaceae bacterium]